jgi:hypothetical protein
VKRIRRIIIDCPTEVVPYMLTPGRLVAPVDVRVNVEVIIDTDEGPHRVGWVKIFDEDMFDSMWERIFEFAVKEIKQEVNK